MGWYSKHIMGGDAPEDYKAEIMHLIGAKRLEKKDNYIYAIANRKISEVLTEKQDMILSKMNKKGRSFEGKVIALQVLGVVMVNNGASINGKVKQAIVKACDEDVWAQTNLERKIYLNDFKNIVIEHDGKTPIDETIDHEKKFGVTNDDWMHGKLSENIAKMALFYYLEHTKDEPWFEGVDIGVNMSGHYLIVVADDNGQYKRVFNSPDFTWELFEIPIVLVSNKDFKKL